MRQPKPFYRKSKDAWYLQIGGKQRSLGKDKAEAFRLYHEIMAGKQPLQESTVTIAELFERFLDWVEKHRKLGTYQNTKKRLSKFAKYIGHNSKAMLVTGDQVTQWVDSEAGWGPTTKNDAITTVQRAYNWALGKQLIERSPVAVIPDKPSRKRRETVFSKAEWDELRAFVKDDAFGDFLDFMYETGCRPLECRTMEARHVDLENEMVVFPVSEAKGERTERVIFLSTTALEICKRRWQPDGPLMRNLRDRPWTKDSINCRFRRLREKIGRSACAYAVRHSFATEALKSGMDSLTLAQLMGHQDVSTLARNYAHLARNPQYLKEQAKKLRG